MKLKASCDSTKDIIVEEDGNLYYITEFKKKKQKKLSISRFSSFVQRELQTTDNEQHSKPRDLSHLQIYTFMVINNGLNPVKCQAEMSTDGINWGSFGDSELTISPGNKQVIVPQYFLRFARIKYINQTQGFNSVITIWFQGQS